MTIVEKLKIKIRDFRQMCKGSDPEVEVYLSDLEDYYVALESQAEEIQTLHEVASAETQKRIDADQRITELERALVEIDKMAWEASSLAPRYAAKEYDGTYLEIGKIHDKAVELLPKEKL